MAGNKKRRMRALTNILYTLILLAYTAVIAFMGVTWLSRVNDYAEQYELSRPAKAVDAYLETINRDRWNDGIARAVAAMPHEAQTDEEIKAFVQNRLSGGVTAVRKSGVTDNDVIGYSLRCDGREIGSMSIAEDQSYRGKVDLDELPWTLVSRFLPGILEWGLKPWTVVEDSFDFTNLYTSVEITVPSTYTVSINGTVLGPEYIIEDGIHYDVYDKYYYDMPDLPTKVTYRFDNAIGLVEPEIRDEDGNVVVVDAARGDIQFVRPVDEETLQRLEAFMLPFTDKYLAFRSGAGDSGTALAALKQYIIPNSDIYRRAEDAMDGMSWAHTASYKMTDFRFNGALPLMNGVYICDVTATTDTYTYGKGEVEDVINLSVIVCDFGEAILAYQVN